MIPSQITEAGFISPGPDESHKTHYGLCLNPVLRSDGGDEIVDKTDDTPYKNLDWDPNWLELLLGGHDLIGIMDTTEEHLGSDLDFLVSGLTMSDGDICGVRQCSDCKEDKPSVVMTAYPPLFFCSGCLEAKRAKRDMVNADRRDRYCKDKYSKDKAKPPYTHAKFLVCMQRNENMRSEGIMEYSGEIMENPEKRARIQADAVAILATAREMVRQRHEVSKGKTGTHRGR